MNKVNPKMKKEEFLRQFKRLGIVFTGNKDIQNPEFIREYWEAVCYSYEADIFRQAVSECISQDDTYFPRPARLKFLCYEIFTKKMAEKNRIDFENNFIETENPFSKQLDEIMKKNEIEAQSRNMSIGQYAREVLFPKIRRQGMLTYH